MSKEECSIPLLGFPKEGHTVDDGTPIYWCRPTRGTTAYVWQNVYQKGTDNFTVEIHKGRKSLNRFWSEHSLEAKDVVSLLQAAAVIQHFAEKYASGGYACRSDVLEIGDEP